MRRQVHQGHIAWDLQGIAEVPAGAIEYQHGMGLRRQRLAQLHRPLENERADRPKVNGWSGSMNSTLG